MLTNLLTDLLQFDMDAQRSQGDCWCSIYYRLYVLRDAELAFSEHSKTLTAFSVDYICGRRKK